MIHFQVSSGVKHQYANFTFSGGWGRGKVALGKSEVIMLRSVPKCQLCIPGEEGV